jgi:hypothetical protein
VGRGRAATENSETLPAAGRGLRYAQNYTPMKRLGKAILLAAIALAGAGGRARAEEKGRFDPRPAAEYPARQTADQVTIAVEAYDSSEKVKQAFGKADPLKLGVIPILVVVANGSSDALRLDRIRVQLISGDREIASSIPPEDVRRGSLKPPTLGGARSPFPGIGRRKPKDEFAITERAFAAPVVEAGGRAYGFFYFQVARDQLRGTRVYITGLRNARTRKDLLYFEIPLHAGGPPAN